MPKALRDVRSFITVSKRADATSVTIHKPLRKRQADTKFKVRCSSYLYTFTVKDKDKASKLEAAIPDSLKRIYIRKHKKKAKSTLQ